ncbi:MAG TPA: NAD(P)H-hydrate epimerase [Propionibacteriaceae bacterium]|nr:NAD(P)H-hydrate epimerase [Propionibacteriaceae bacterium]
MLEAYGVDTIRRVEQAVIDQVGDDTLMQRAASGLAAAVARAAVRLLGRVYGARVVILVGPGNNGGDALFAGARLARRGAAVTAVRCLGTPHARGLAALQTAGGRLIDIGDLDLVEDRRVRANLRLEADVAVDGVLGIGGRPGLPDDVALLARDLASFSVPTIAVDLPSGVGADSGAVPADAFWATQTVTFGELKPCHLVEPARQRCGKVEVVDIGLGSIPPGTGDLWLRQVEVEDLAMCWPYPDARSDKYSRGVVGIDTGSDTYPGAAIMTVHGAVHAGAGMVRFLGADRPAEVIGSQLPNVVFAPGQVQSHLFGSGWGDRADGGEVLQRALESELPTVVDADGLRYLPERLPEHWLLTPHAGELARLLGEDRSWVTEDPVRAVRTGVAKTGATVLLKGATQLVAGPQRDWVEIALPGPGWTGQAGSGDTLGGMCAALAAAGLPVADAAVLAASLQAYTASRHPGPIPPVRLAELAAEELGRLQQLNHELDEENRWAPRPPGTA